MNLIIRNTVTVEIVIANPAVNTPYNFPDVPNLRMGNSGYVKTCGIIVHANDVDYTTSTSNTTILTQAQLRETILSLFVKDRADVWNIPAYSLVAASNGGEVRQFADIPIEITKSFIQLNDITTTAIGANATFACTFIYK